MRAKLSDMVEADRIFRVPTKELSLAHDVAWVVALGAFMAVDYAVEEEANAVLTALLTGQLLALGLRVLKASPRTRMRVFWLPLTLLFVYGFGVDSRLWLKPVWLGGSLLFGLLVSAPDLKVELRADVLVVHGFLKRKIPYSTVAGVREGKPTRNYARAVIEITKKKRFLGKVWNEIWVGIPQEDIDSFISEVSRRIAATHS